MLLKIQHLLKRSLIRIRFHLKEDSIVVGRQKNAGIQSDMVEYNYSYSSSSKLKIERVSAIKVLPADIIYIFVTGAW